MDIFKNFRSTGDRDRLKIIPLAGLEFIGANCTVVEYGEDLIVIDAGLGFPSLEHLGVDYIIPNASYLLKNQKKIRGLVITHGHLDHIGAVAHMMEPMGYPPIYASNFAKELITEKFKMDAPDLLTKVTIYPINTTSKLKFGNLNVGFFHVNHSIPESMGVHINTPVGNIVHTGDFKFDNMPLNEPHPDYATIAKMGAEGVLCLLSDSTNSYREGHSLSESEIVKILDNLISDLDGRVVVATFASMVNRIIELLRIAVKYNRRVFVSGKSMKTAIKIAQKIGYAKLPPNLFVNGADVKNIPDNKLMILATGSQGEALAALGRMARDEHKDVKIKKGDTVLLSSSTIPGNGSDVQGMIDNLTRKGANVYHNEIMNLHTTGHGHKEEQKLMINLVKPKFFMPVHGFQSFLAEHAKTAISMGIPEANVIIAGDGDVIELTPNTWKKATKINARPVIVSGAIVGDIGNIILDDRKQLASYGVVAYNLTVDKKTRKLVVNPRITSRGFVYVKTNKALFDEALIMIKEIYNEMLTKGTQSEDVRKEISFRLTKYFAKATEREPLVVGLITEL